MTGHDAHPESKFWDLIEDIRICMLATSRGDVIESRPMSAYPDRDGRVIWFITPLDTEKTHEIGDGEAVNLSFADTGDSTYVAVVGHARVIRDVARQKQLWNAFAEAWLPQGPEAENVGLIRVDPVRATFWDSPSSKVAQLWEVAKANVTQTPPDNDEVRTVNLR
jgi:general stress protein 26